MFDLNQESKVRVHGYVFITFKPFRPKILKWILPALIWICLLVPIGGLFKIIHIMSNNADPGPESRKHFDALLI